LSADAKAVTMLRPGSWSGPAGGPPARAGTEAIVRPVDDLAATFDNAEEFCPGGAEGTQ
jgi:hypothetical protein